MLLDVSRLLWRRLAGRRPTGIDRVCLQYLRHFSGHPGARALFHWRRIRWVMPEFISRRIFQWLLPDDQVLAQADGLPATSLFIGHTGLQWPGFADWVRRDLPPALVFIHDLIPLTHPALCRPGQDRVHARRMREALRAAQGVVVNSRHTAEELAAFASAQRLPLPPVCVAVLGSGLDASPGIADEKPPLDRPYFVILGTVEARKNHALLLDLWERWADDYSAHEESPPTLVVIGQAGWEARETLERLQAARGPWVWVRDADDACVANHLRHARAVLMPSRAEGYGMPVAEALALGTPVICSDLPALREVGGCVPDYLPAEDAEAWLAAVKCHARGDASPMRQAQLQRLSQWVEPDWAGHFDTVRRFIADIGRAP